MDVKIHPMREDTDGRVCTLKSWRKNTGRMPEAFIARQTLEKCPRLPAAGRKHPSSG